MSLPFRSLDIPTTDFKNHYSAVLKNCECFTIIIGPTSFNYIANADLSLMCPYPPIAFKTMEEAIILKDKFVLIADNFTVVQCLKTTDGYFVQFLKLDSSKYVLKTISKSNYEWFGSVGFGILIGLFVSSFFTSPTSSLISKP